LLRFEMKSRVLALTAVAEAAMGVALIVLPSLVVRLLLGSYLAGVANPLARVAGIACSLWVLPAFPAARRFAAC